MGKMVKTEEMNLRENSTIFLSIHPGFDGIWRKMKKVKLSDDYRKKQK